MQISAITLLASQQAAAPASPRLIQPSSGAAMRKTEPFAPPEFTAATPQKAAEPTREVASRPGVHIDIKV